MKHLITALDERTRGTMWPDRWMTLAEIDAELEDQGFWASAGLASWSAEGRRHWLRAALATEKPGGRAIWLRMGGRYKHFDLMRQNRSDVNDYLTWFRESRGSRADRAEAILAGQDRVGKARLHPLAPPPEECALRAEALTAEVIGAVSDEEIAARLRRIWGIYEAGRPADPLAGLRVCRLFCAMATLIVEAKKDGCDPLRAAVARAEKAIDSLMWVERPSEEEVAEEARAA